MFVTHSLLRQRKRPSKKKPEQWFNALQNCKHGENKGRFSGHLASRWERHHWQGNNFLSSQVDLFSWFSVLCQMFSIQKNCLIFVKWDLSSSQCTCGQEFTGVHGDRKQSEPRAWNLTRIREATHVLCQNRHFSALGSNTEKWHLLKVYFFDPETGHGTWFERLICTQMFTRRKKTWWEVKNLLPTPGIPDKTGSPHSLDNKDLTIPRSQTQTSSSRTAIHEPEQSNSTCLKLGPQNNGQKFSSAHCRNRISWIPFLDFSSGHLHVDTLVPCFCKFLELPGSESNRHKAQIQNVFFFSLQQKRISFFFLRHNDESSG